MTGNVLYHYFAGGFQTYQFLSPIYLSCLIMSELRRQYIIYYLRKFMWVYYYYYYLIIRTPVFNYMNLGCMTTELDLCIRLLQSNN